MLKGIYGCELPVLCHYLNRFCDHRHYGSENIKSLIYDVTACLKGHVTISIGAPLCKFRSHRLCVIVDVLVLVCHIL